MAANPPAPKLGELREEYAALFKSCVIAPSRAEDVATIVRRIVERRERYVAVSEAVRTAKNTTVPWHFIAVVHNLEGSLSFEKHLHNGDPLTARTVRVPKGRPSTGAPPFTWEASAADALRLRKLNERTDWSVPGLLHKIEDYNGWGYRWHHPEVLSPYLWSFTNHYTRGKYATDGVWDANLVSKQCGVAALLRKMVDDGVVVVDSATPRT